MKGRKSIPISIKEAKGTLRKNRLTGQSPADFQSKDPAELPFWLDRKYLKDFELIRKAADEVGLNSMTYSHLMGLAAKCSYEIKSCDRLISKHGRMIQGPRGRQFNPAIRHQKDCMRHLQSLLAEFGLTPTALIRLGGLNDIEPSKTGFADL